MFARRLLRASFVDNLRSATSRPYTVVVERSERMPLLKKDADPRSFNLKSKHFRYKFIECKHAQKWGEVEVILTEYVEGVGHKGEILSVPRHQAYYELFPSRLAVYPTEEYLEFYKKDRELAASKPKVSPYAIKTQDELNKMILNIPMNMGVDWTLNRDHIRLALRYNKVMCSNECIEIPQNLEVSRKNVQSHGEVFVVNVRINDYLSAHLRCKIVAMEKEKLWEKFAAFNKTF